MSALARRPSAPRGTVVESTPACFRPDLVKIDPAELRAFVERDRRRVQEAKRAHWSRVAREDPNVGIELAHALYDHARIVSPVFGSPESRQADFEHHLRLKGLIDRASRALSIRRRTR